MLDRHLHPRIKPALNRLVSALDKPGITPDGLTTAGFAIGLLTLPFLALGWYPAALVAIVLNRLLDGLDGALARRRGLTDAGGFLDIALDFLFYALVPFGFALAAPEQNTLAAAAAVRIYWHREQLSGLCGTGGEAQYRQPRLCAQVVLLHRRVNGGTETIVLFVLCCLFPAHFAVFAWIFGALCWLTTTTRIWSGYVTLKSLKP